MYELKVFKQKIKVNKTEEKTTKGIFLKSEEVKVITKLKLETYEEIFIRIKDWANENRVKIISTQKGDCYKVTVTGKYDLPVGSTVDFQSFIVLYEKSEIPEGNLVTL